MAKISIVVPCYNTPEEYLNTCIDSILAQNFSDYEVILVDDGSDEVYHDLIERAAAKDERIRVVREENQGVSAARNLGTSRCLGDYIAYCDSDDTMLPGYLQEAYDLAEEYQTDIVYGMEYRGEPTGEQAPAGETNIITDADDRWLKKHHVGPVYKDGDNVFGRGPYCRLIKAELAKSTLFPEGVPLGEDVLWNLDVMQKAKIKIVVRNVWYRYRVREDSATRKFDPEIEKKLEMFYDLLPDFVDVEGCDRANYVTRRMYDLINYVFLCNYGHPKNPMPFFRRWRAYNGVCDRRPWCIVKNSELSLFEDRREKIKAFLIRTHLFFCFRSIKEMIR